MFTVWLTCKEQKLNEKNMRTTAGSTLGCYIYSNASRVSASVLFIYFVESPTSALVNVLHLLFEFFSLIFFKRLLADSEKKKKKEMRSPVLRVDQSQDAKRSSKTGLLTLVTSRFP